MKRLLLGWLLSALVNQVAAQSLEAKYVEQVARKLMDTATVTGLQIGIVENGRVSYVSSFGYRNKARNLWNDPNTCFYGASLAKSLFAYLVMQLVDEKQLDLDTPLYKYLPKPLPTYEPYQQLAADERYLSITARMCLSHTTGFPNLRELTGGKLKIQFAPGTMYAYSGEGIMLLQLVVEVLTGKPLAVLARERIFKPFNMSRTDFEWQSRFESNYAVGHQVNEDTVAKVRRKVASAAGSMETTITDYTRFMAAVMSSEKLSATSWKQMLSPQIQIKSRQQFDPFDTSGKVENEKIGLSYGLGWGLFNSSIGKAFFKEGHIDGWMHYVIGFPERGNAIVVMSNSSNAESIYKELIEKLTGVTIPWYWERYIPYRANLKLISSSLQAYKGVYEGKLKAILSIENGCLYIESPSVDLAKTRIYAEGNDKFYMKTMDVEIRFIKDGNGKVLKVSVDDEGEQYELEKIE